VGGPCHRRMCVVRIELLQNIQLLARAKPGPREQDGNRDRISLRGMNAEI